MAKPGAQLLDGEIGTQRRPPAGAVVPPQKIEQTERGVSDPRAGVTILGQQEASLGSRHIRFPISRLCRGCRLLRDAPRESAHRPTCFRMLRVSLTRLLSKSF